jgi:hypothetical protein
MPSANNTIQLAPQHWQSQWHTPSFPFVSATAPKPVAHGSNAVRQCHPAGNGTTGVAVTLGSATNGVTLNNGALALQTTDGYSLNVAGPIAGPGTLGVSQGAVALSAGGNAGTVNVTGGSVTLGADLGVNRMRVTDGVLDTGSHQVVVSNRLQLGEVPFSISDGDTFTATGANMPTVANLTLAGGTMEIGGGTGIPSDGLLAFYQFDNDADLGFDSVTTNSLAVAGNASYDAGGVRDGALRVDGDGDYLYGSPTVPIGNSAYAISAWIRPELTGDRGIVGWGNYGTTRMVNALRLMGDNGFRHYWWGADLDTDAGVAGVNLDDGNWHHVVAMYDGDALRSMYLDGTLIGSGDPGDNNATAANFRIGSTNNGEYFGGMIDELAIYDRAVSEDEIAVLFDPPPAGEAIDLPGVNLLVTESTSVQLNTFDDAILGDLSVEPGVALMVTGAGASFNDVTTGADVDMTIAALLIRGTLTTGAGPLNLDGEFEMEDDATFAPGLAANSGSVVVLGDADVNGTLAPVGLPAGSQGLAGLGAIGDHTLTVVETVEEGQISGGFTTTPDDGDHLGAGIFATTQGANGQVVTQGANTIDLDLFQAIAGDTDGNRDVNGFDIQAILSANKFGKPLAADWTEGDFTGDGFVNGFDIQAILSANQFGKGPYAAADAAVGGVNAVPEPGTIALLLSGLAGLTLLAVRRRRA